MKKNLIYFLMLITCSGVAQSMTSAKADPDTSTTLVSKTNYEELFREHFSFSSASGYSSLSKANSLSYSFPNPCMSGMFCKIEYKLEAKSGLAPRFRLGSLSYSNWMEGKGSLINRY